MKRKGVDISGPIAPCTAADLKAAGVEFVIQQDRQNGSFFGIGLQLVPPSVEYIIYVHEDDFELAQAALQGTLN